MFILFYGRDPQSSSLSFCFFNASLCFRRILILLHDPTTTRLSRGVIVKHYEIWTCSTVCCFKEAKWKKDAKKPSDKGIDCKNCPFFIHSPIVSTAHNLLLFSYCKRLLMMPNEWWNSNLIYAEIFLFNRFFFLSTIVERQSM